jgi:hypothetical protein
MPDQIIKVPDTSKLPVITFEPMLELKVLDDTTLAKASEYKQLAKSFIKSIDELFDAPIASANAAHKDMIALKKKLLGLAPQVLQHCITEASNWERQENAKRQLIAQKARELQEKAIEEALPFEEDAPEPVEISLPPAQVPGFNKRYKPWSFRLKQPDGLMTLVKAIAEGKVPLTDEFGTPILELNTAHFKNAAKKLEAQLEDRYPGVEGYRETSLS